MTTSQELPQTAETTEADGQPETPVVDSPKQPVQLDAVTETAATETADEDDDDGELTPDELRGELDRARKQAAKYRTRLRTAETELKEAKTKLDATPEPLAIDPIIAVEQRAAAAERRALIAEAAAEANIPTAAIKAFRQLEAAEGDDGIKAALDVLKQYLAGTPGGPKSPPTEQGRSLTNDELIADAERTGDVRTTMRLKSAKLAALGSK